MEEYWKDGYGEIQFISDCAGLEYSDEGASPMDFEKYMNRINSLGVKVLDGREHVDGEGRSIYFYDYDNHLFEIHTGTLSERLLQYSNHVNNE